MKITVLTGADKTYWSLMQLVAPNRTEYCMRHGYQLSLMNYRELKEHFNESSIAFIERDTRILKALRECNWLFYMDVDSIITNMTIPLEKIIEEYEEYNFIISNLSNGINNGIMLIHNCSATINFLTTIIEDLHTYNNDQGAMADILKRTSNMQIAKIDQTIFNSINDTWEKGHFVLHVPSLKYEDRLCILKEKLQEVVR